MARRTRIIFVIFVCLGAFVFVTILGNPLNLGVQKSEKFTVSKFLEINEGDKINEVVESLGEPITIMQADPDSSCSDCSYYYFEGKPSDWLVAYREAWVIVGSNGIVKRKILHTEP